MEAVLAILSPDQIDLVIAAYGTVAEWYTQVADIITPQTTSVVIEDMPF